MKQRILRVNELIRQTVSEMLQRDINPDRFGVVTVTEVRASNDLRYAKIFFSVFGTSSQRESVVQWLESRTAAIQRELGGHIRLRYTPHIRFLLDETEDRLDRISNILKNLNA